MNTQSDAVVAGIRFLRLHQPALLAMAGLAGAVVEIRAEFDEAHRSATTMKA